MKAGRMPSISVVVSFISSYMNKKKQLIVLVVYIQGVQKMSVSSGFEFLTLEGVFLSINFEISWSFGP